MPPVSAAPLPRLAQEAAAAARLEHGNCRWRDVWSEWRPAFPRRAPARLPGGLCRGRARPAGLGAADPGPGRDLAPYRLAPLPGPRPADASLPGYLHGSCGRSPWRRNGARWCPLRRFYPGRRPRLPGPHRPDVLRRRGSVKIRFADPRVHPALRFNYLSTDTDRREWVEAIHVARHILNQRAFDPYHDHCHAVVEPIHHELHGYELLRRTTDARGQRGVNLQRG